jgi:CubicO group peptidase (beta-lactamase class C family)
MNQIKVGWLILLLLTSLGREHNVEAAPENPVPKPITGENVAAFVDAFVAENMESAHVPGLVVTVVHRDQVILARGYGVADVTTGRPMTARTPLRAGSVSKPVTAAAVLQLAAGGKMDLDNPISTYLPGLPLADDFGPAATGAQLLVLQGGYADTVVQTHTPNLESWQPLDIYLEAHLPARTLPPGTVYSYNSWDHALLGQAMAEITQQPFDQVVQQTILQPLEMTQTTFTQPLPGEIAADLAQGYAYSDGRYEEVPLDYVQLSPGIALVTTGQDMGRFLLALLNDGMLDGERVLAKEAVTGMLTRQGTVHPRSRGRTYGFSEVTISDRRALYQDGNGIGQSNRLVLVPDQQLGIFISLNHRPLGHDAGSTPANQFMRDLSASLLETFVPAEKTNPSLLPVLPDADARSDRFTGHYRLAGTPQEDFFKLGALLDNVNVKANGDDTITIGSNRYREVEPLLFQSEQNPGFFVVFGEDEAGDVQWLTFGGTGSYVRAAWYETPAFQIALAAFTLIVALMVMITTPFGDSRNWLMWTVSLLQIIFLAGVAGMMLRADLLLFFKTIPLPTQLLFMLPWLVGMLTLALPPALVLLWRQQAASWVQLMAGLHLVSAAGFIWFVRFWNLYWKF